MMYRFFLEKRRRAAHDVQVELLNLEICSGGPIMGVNELNLQKSPFECGSICCECELVVA
jgi:hypothetical protein